MIEDVDLALSALGMGAFFINDDGGCGGAITGVRGPRPFGAARYFASGSCAADAPSSATWKSVPD